MKGILDISGNRVEFGSELQAIGNGKGKTYKEVARSSLLMEKGRGPQGQG